jgi:hypothetical protein
MMNRQRRSRPTTSVVGRDRTVPPALPDRPQLYIAEYEPPFYVRSSGMTAAHLIIKGRAGAAYAL